METSLFKFCFMLGILSCISLVIGDVGKCSSGVQYCHYSSWFPWGHCNVTSSGEYKQIRERTFCCKVSVNCLKTCNISNYVYQEEKICIDESTHCRFFVILSLIKKTNTNSYINELVHGNYQIGNIENHIFFYKTVQ